MKAKRSNDSEKWIYLGWVNRLASFFILIGMLVTGFISTCYAGAYFFADATRIDNITHPVGYNGTGGPLTIGVCIDPSTDPTINTIALQMQIPVQNIIDTINLQNVTTGNLALNAINSATIDFESVALHELGHCLGLGHVNASSESGLADADQDYTKATNGVNAVFNILPGIDGLIGSSDDVRADDVNLHWFNLGINNPFLVSVVNPIDSSTYGRDLVGLPGGHNFAVNANRSISASFGVPNTESIMQQGTFAGEAQRTIIADDVATFRYAMSGLDEIENTTDDYTLNLVYRGITNSNCDIMITVGTGFASCSSGGTSVGAGDHFSLLSPTITIGGSGINWFYNNVRNVAADLVPDAFVFTDQTNVGLNAVITSNNITVSGITSTTAISVTGGEYSINGGTFISSAGIISNGNTVRVRHTSSTSISTQTDTTLDIGGVTDIFRSTTTVADTVPNLFFFGNLVNILSSSVVSSSAVILTGYTTAPITVSGGEYRINNGSFGVASGVINSGDSVTVRHTASANFSTATNTILTVGGVVGQFISVTQPAPTPALPPPPAVNSGGGGGVLNPLMAILGLFLSIIPWYRRGKQVDQFMKRYSASDTSEVP